MAKAKTPRSKTLPEAEGRLRASLERLETLIKAQKASGTEAERLRSKNAQLESDFKDLKGEYSALETSFNELKDSVAKMSAQKKAEKSRDELGEGLEGKANLDPETDFLKKELERVHKEYKTLDQSFRVLRSQYNELQKSYEDALDGGAEQQDMLAEVSAAGEAKADKGLGDLKKDLGSQLDKTISALEKLVG